MSARAGLRFFHSARQSTFRSSFKNHSQVFRRHQTTATNPAATAEPQSFFQRLWTSEVGIKTVHFWAPIMKWGVVLAGASDFFRPPEKLSITQNLALMATGAIWTRWCFIIKPKNVLLAAVNFCLFLVGTTQVSRIMIYRSQTEGGVDNAVKKVAGDVVGPAKQLEKKAEKEMA